MKREIEKFKFSCILFLIAAMYGTMGESSSIKIYCYERLFELNEDGSVIEYKNHNKNLTHTVSLKNDVASDSKWLWEDRADKVYLFKKTFFGLGKKKDIPSIIVFKNYFQAYQPNDRHGPQKVDNCKYLAPLKRSEINEEVYTIKETVKAKIEYRYGKKVAPFTQKYRFEFKLNSREQLVSVNFNGNKYSKFLTRDDETGRYVLSTKDGKKKIKVFSSNNPNDFVEWGGWFEYIPLKITACVNAIWEKFDREQSDCVYMRLDRISEYWRTGGSTEIPKFSETK